MPDTPRRKPPAPPSGARPKLTPAEQRDVTEIREQIVMTGAHLDNAESGYREMISGKTHGDRLDGAERLQRGLRSARAHNREALRVVRGMGRR